MSHIYNDPPGGDELHAYPIDTVACRTCREPHGNRFFEKLGLMIHWFCSETCRARFLDRLQASPQREFMEHGGWQ